MRYSLIKTILERYKRRFILLDLGSGYARESRQAVSDFDCIAVLVEKGLDTEVYPIDFKEPRLIALRKEFSIDDLIRFSECEHFDVVLALNFIHWFEADWQRALETVLALGRDVVIQIPKPEETSAPGAKYLKEMNECLLHFGQVLGETVQFPRHPPRPLYYIHRRDKTVLRRTCWTGAGEAKTRVTLTDDRCTIKVLNKRRRGLVPGINLWNFCCLGGVYPFRDYVLSLLKNFELPKENHGDVAPHNFIFDGESLYLIDGNEGWEFCDKLGLEKTIAKVEGIL